MTRDGEILILREHLSTIDRLAARLTRLRERLGKLMPMSGVRLRSLDEDDDIDILALLKTFEQLEDTIGRTLKAIAIVMQLGKVERLTPRDVTARAVALGVLSDGKPWADAVRVRNELAHEYPLNPVRQAEQVNAAWEKSDALFWAAAAIRDFVTRERLLEGDL